MLILDADDHKQALARIDELMDAEKGTRKGRELDRLVRDVQRYEANEERVAAINACALKTGCSRKIGPAGCHICESGIGYDPRGVHKGLCSDWNVMGCQCSREGR